MKSGKNVNCNLSMAVCLCLAVGLFTTASAEEKSFRFQSDFGNPVEVAAEVDRLIDKELTKQGSKPADLTNDEDFLRRVYFDLSGTTPSPAEISTFGLRPSKAKREQMIDRLLSTEDYANNWARYWRDVIYSRATEMRAARQRPIFEAWMAEQLKQESSWADITTELLTATGSVRENGATALIYAHAADGETIAAESSRIFLGIQIQCAQCHDHLTDKWTRVQFHQLAAFFPRVNVRRIKDSAPRDFEVVSQQKRQNDRLQKVIAILDNPEDFIRKYDKNNDGNISSKEVPRKLFVGPYRRFLKNADKNEDEALSLEELKGVSIPPRLRNQTAEHYMPDLDDPSKMGQKMSPVFFVSNQKIKSDLPDIERRAEAARLITSKGNEWFAKAYVNRIWTVLMGNGFYPAIDDIGPERKVHHAQVIEILSKGFIANNHDVKWLFRAILNTQTYQRQSAEMPATEADPNFATVAPMRLRADQLFAALTCAFDVTSLKYTDQNKRGPDRSRSAREQFNKIFTFDPSNAPSDIAGTIPQTLFLMNSSKINNLISSRNSIVHQILEINLTDQETITEIYLKILGREPEAHEEKIVLSYIKESNNRQEAFEDLVWSLINTTEFITKR